MEVAGDVFIVCVRKPQVEQEPNELLGLIGLDTLSYCHRGLGDDGLLLLLSQNRFHGGEYRDEVLVGLSDFDIDLLLPLLLRLVLLLRAESHFLLFVRGL